MNAQGLTHREAIIEITAMRERVFVGGENPEEVLHEYGLEPDYVLDLLFYNPNASILNP